MSSCAEMSRQDGIGFSLRGESARVSEGSLPVHLGAEGNLCRPVPTPTAFVPRIAAPNLSWSLPSGWGLVSQVEGGVVRAGTWTPAEHRAQREDEELAVMLAHELVTSDATETRFERMAVTYIERRFGALGRRFAGWMRATVLAHDERENAAHLELLETTRRMTLRRTAVIARGQEKSSEAVSATPEQPRGKNLMNSTTQTRRRGQ